jgi:hypothetical protein
MTFLDYALANYVSEDSIFPTPWAAGPVSEPITTNYPEEVPSTLYCPVLLVTKKFTKFVTSSLLLRAKQM